MGRGGINSVYSSGGTLNNAGMCPANRPASFRATGAIQCTECPGDSVCAKRCHWRYTGPPAPNQPVLSLSPPPLLYPPRSVFAFGVGFSSLGNDVVKQADHFVSSATRLTLFFFCLCCFFLR
ncbi:unnamed protein product [Ectocarpus sp. 4 AP-2014]